MMIRIVIWRIILMKKIGDLGKIVEKIVEDAAKEDGENSSALSSDIMKMPKLALTMANYFNSLSRYCLSVHDSAITKKQNQKKVQSRPQDPQAHHKMNPLKKPLTAYILYYRQKVPSFQEKYKNCTISQLTRLVAKQWSELPQSEKKPYITMAADDRKRYEKEKKEYKQARGHQIKEPEQEKNAKVKKGKKKHRQSSSQESSELAKEEASNSDSYMSDEGV